MSAKSWSLVVATYQRAQVLKRCLSLAAKQSRLPTEIVVVDASPDWLATKSHIIPDLEREFPAIRWIYVEAEIRSSACQRNQGFRLTTSNIVFFFDDDSLMYRDCADQIMRVYEADIYCKIAGINANNVAPPPDNSNDKEALFPSEHSSTQRYGSITKLIRRALRSDELFVPYDETFPKYDMPTELKAFNLAQTNLMVGWGMTFRRDVCEAEPFADILRYYAAEEDSDMSYRASRHGALLFALDASLCHLGSAGGRMNFFLLAVFRNLNPIVLHRLYSTDINRSRWRQRVFLTRRLAILFAKDFYRRKWSFPNSRGLLFAAKQINRVFAMSPAELNAWYPGFQKDTIERFNGNI